MRSSSVLDLEEDRRVALDDVARRFGVARPRRVGDDHGAVRRGGGRPRDRVVVGSVHDLDLSTLGLDAGDSSGHHVGGYEDARVEAEQTCHRRDRATVIAVGRRREGQRAQRCDCGRELVDRGPFGFGSEPLDDGAVRRPRRAEHLERGKAEPVRFDLHEHVPDAECTGQARRIDEGRGFVAGQAFVQVERCAAVACNDTGPGAAQRIAEYEFAHADQSANASIMARTSSPSG